MTADNSGNPFNPELFVYDPAKSYRWQAFDHITIATITWNRLEFTKRFLGSVLKYSHLPFRLLIIDNASTDGTSEYLRNLAANAPNITLVENPKNVGKVRALRQIQGMVDDGLLVYCDNDVEVLTNYWLLLLMKAFHAARVTRGSSDALLGMRLINLDEYGFRHATRREILRIPTAQNDEPRTSYAATSKDDPNPSIRLDEEVVIGWSEFVIGCVQAMPASLFHRIPLDDAYPLFVGADDGFICAELRRLGVPIGYVENGPVVRHNDWPYTEEKIQLYEKLTKTRAVSDFTYVKWKLLRLLGLRRN